MQTNISDPSNPNSNPNAINLTNNSNASQKLRLIISQLMSATNRIQMGQAKNFIRNIVEDMVQLERDRDGQGYMFIEQFLAFCVKYSRLADTLSALQEHLEFTTLYWPSLTQIIRKYLQTPLASNANNSASKLDQPSAKPIRLLLCKKMLQDKVLYYQILQQCKKQPNTCYKFLHLLRQYLTSVSPLSPSSPSLIGNQSPLLILCLHLLKLPYSKFYIPSIIPILYNLIENSQKLRQSALMDVIGEAVLGYFMEGGRACLGVIEIWVNGGKGKMGVFEAVCGKLVEMYGCEIGDDTYSIIKQKYTIIPLAESSQIQSFLISTHKHLQSQSPSSVSTSSLKILKFTTKSLLLSLDRSVIPSLFPIFNDNRKGMEGLFLMQCLYRCGDYQAQAEEGKREGNMWQMEIISFIYQWIGMLAYERAQGVYEGLGLPVPKAHDYEQSDNRGLELFLEFIKKSIQSQFQYQFNTQLMQSVCNLLCFLKPLIISSAPPETASSSDLIPYTNPFQIPPPKPLIAYYIKTLLNLNESCCKSYRPVLVTLILKLLSVYGAYLLPGNQFLREVLENKILENFENCWVFVENVKEFVGNGFYERLGAMLGEIEGFGGTKGGDGEKQAIRERMREKGFELLVSRFKEEMEAVQMGMDGDGNQIQRECQLKVNFKWEWFAYLHACGKRIYGKQWKYSQKVIKSVKQKMQQYPIQFHEDLQKLQPTHKK